VHPFAHLLVGAAVGAFSRSPATSLLGGIVSHLALDTVPHTEEETFTRGRRPGVRLREAQAGAPRPSRRRRGRRRRLTPGLMLAGLELVLGSLIVAWLISRCGGLGPWSVGLGALGGIVPDLVDAPMHMFFGVRLMHISQLHWTVTRRYALWGIATQIAAAGAAAAVLWRLGGCG
jgi:hypothetical protein